MVVASRQIRHKRGGEVECRIRQQNPSQVCVSTHHQPLIFLNPVTWYEMPLFAEFGGLSTTNLCRMLVIVSALKPRGYGRTCIDDLIPRFTEVSFESVVQTPVL
jgi:hypothetical protein